MVPFDGGGNSMATVATCPCGTKFVVRSATFPRPVACHACGARAVLGSPTEIAAGEGWRVGEEEAPETPKGPVVPPGMVRCHVCGIASSAACARCGRFYCMQHGRARALGRVSTCIACYDAARLGMLLMAGTLAALGLYFLLLPQFTALPEAIASRVGSPYWVMLPLAGFLYCASALHVWLALRPYP
jgi:hypothetical protein